MLFNSCHRDLDNIFDSPTPLLVPINSLSLYYSGDGIVQLGWYSYGYDYTKFIIYYSTTGEKDSFKKIGETTQSYYTINNLSYDTTYYLAVTIWYNGYESDLSNIIITKPINKNPPSTPVNLEVYGLNYEGKLSMNLSWSKNTEGDLWKYYIYRQDSNSSFLKIAETIDNYYVDTSKIKLNILYTYKIAAIDKGGLLSNLSLPNYDRVLDTVTLIYPISNITVKDYISFKWKGVNYADGYKIFLMNSKYGTEIWQKTIYSSNKEDYEIAYDGYSLAYRKNYYWKVCAFSKGSNYLNSYSVPNIFYFTYSE